MFWRTCRIDSWFFVTERQVGLTLGAPLVSTIRSVATAFNQSGPVRGVASLIIKKGRHEMVQQI
jgi:hypothetical protein